MKPSKKLILSCIILSSFALVIVAGMIVAHGWIGGGLYCLSAVVLGALFYKGYGLAFVR